MRLSLPLLFHSGHPFCALPGSHLTPHMQRRCDSGLSTFSDGPCHSALQTLNCASVVDIQAYALSFALLPTSSTLAAPSAACASYIYGVRIAHHTAYFTYHSVSLAHDAWARQQNVAEFPSSPECSNGERVIAHRQALAKLQNLPRAPWG